MSIATFFLTPEAICASIDCSCIKFCQFRLSSWTPPALLTLLVLASNHLDVAAFETGVVSSTVWTFISFLAVLYFWLVAPSLFLSMLSMEPHSNGDLSKSKSWVPNFPSLFREALVVGMMTFWVDYFFSMARFRVISILGVCDSLKRRFREIGARRGVLVIIFVYNAILFRSWFLRLLRSSRTR